ncbi:transglycosylase domain-containing protein [Streptomyces sp. NPDC059985]|uniref:transglycosylase domain-containing protein n=1 Tax=Streptomyces sp. NPDC059985 TaxID=3347025 RepID=UPI0036B4E8D7
MPGWPLIIGVPLVLGALAGGAALAGYLMVDIPSANAAAVAQSNDYFYSDGSLLARDGQVNRQTVSLARVPRRVKEAVLAAEHRKFYSEPDVDPVAMARAAWNTARGKGRQSGSTITQQYVKNYYLNQDQTIQRKIKEIFIAVKLGHTNSKSEILEGYLNTSYFGRSSYGIQAGAQAYYRKNVDELTTSEAAYLATLLNSPSSLDIATHPKNRGRALSRWNYVLDGMVEEGWLTPRERAKADFPEPADPIPASGMSGQRGYIVEAVKNYVTTHGIIDKESIEKGGYRITTTLDRRHQQALLQSVQQQFTSRLSPRTRRPDRLARAGGVSIDPATGRVTAVYGGIDYTRQYVSSATRRDYQAASLFKPIVFASAVNYGSRTLLGQPISPGTLYNGDDRRPVFGSGAPYFPENEGRRSYGDITVHAAMAYSVNSVFAQMAADVGPARVKETAIALGIPKSTPSFEAGPSIALGAPQPSVLDLAQAYATLAAHGRLSPYTLVDKVSRGDSALALPERPARQAVRREAADTTTSMLIDVVKRGSGTAALAVGRPAAGKTGTSENNLSAWFAGYTPDLATVIAVLGQDPDAGTLEPLRGVLGEPRISGGGYPARIWSAYTRVALADLPARDFDLQLQPGFQPATLP